MALSVLERSFKKGRAHIVFFVVFWMLQHLASVFAPASREVQLFLSKICGRHVHAPCYSHVCLFNAF
jgi:hypothetical protein